VTTSVFIDDTFPVERATSDIANGSV